MNEKDNISRLFHAGLGHYNSKNFFDAHEVWEELWSEYYLADRKFIQGLIQLSVSFVHLENGNVKGAKSLLKKCREKFESFSGIQRGINMKVLLESIEQVHTAYEAEDFPNDFDWNLVPVLE